MERRTNTTIKEAILEKMYKKRDKGYKTLGYIVKEKGSEEKVISEQMKLF